MCRFAASVLVIALVGCGGSGAVTAPTVRNGPDPILPEEKAAWELIQQRLRKPTVLQWGPHDLEGVLAKEAQKRRGQGWAAVPSRYAGRARPNTRFIAVRVRHIPTSPTVDQFIIPLEGGRPVRIYPGDDDSPTMDLYNFPLDDWIESELEAIRKADKRGE